MLTVCVSAQQPATPLGLSNMSSQDNLYFIITEKPEYPAHLKAGSICFIPEIKHKSKKNRLSSKLPVTPLRSQLDYDIDTKCLRALRAEEAELLQALPADADRLKWFGRKDALQAALGLSPGTEVMVEEEGKELRGVIRYIGSLTEPKYLDPLPGKYFGVELQVCFQRVCSTITFSGLPLLTVVLLSFDSTTHRRIHSHNVGHT